MITPEIEVEQTISNPADQAEVLGFTGRNKKLGHPSVVMKESAIMDTDDGKEIIVPEEAAELIREERGELLVLAPAEVLAMNWEDFDAKARSVRLKGGGQVVSVFQIPMSSMGFRTFGRNQVEIGN